MSGSHAAKKRKAAATVIFVAFLAIAALSGCSTQKLEDIIGPAPAPGARPIPTQQQSPNVASLVQPPQDVIVSENSANAGRDLAQDAEEAPVAPPAELPSILAVQEDQKRFTAETPWQAFVSADGVDATNADGTICSGRFSGERQSFKIGAKVDLACSDGSSARLEVLSGTAAAGTGRISIHNMAQTASISVDGAGRCKLTPVQLCP